MMRHFFRCLVVLTVVAAASPVSLKAHAVQSAWQPVAADNDDIAQPRARISGTVVYADASLGVFVNTARETIEVRPIEFVPVAPGDQIQATGRVVIEDGRHILVDAHIVRGLETTQRPIGRISRAGAIPDYQSVSVRPKS